MQKSFNNDPSDFTYYCSGQILYSVMHSMILNLHPVVTCLLSPQLTLPEGTQSHFGHTLTACRVCPGQVHATTFGGSPKFEYHLGKLDDAHLKLAETTVMEFGEYKAPHIALYCTLTDRLYTQSQQ